VQKVQKSAGQIRLIGERRKYAVRYATGCRWSYTGELMLFPMPDGSVSAGFGTEHEIVLIDPRAIVTAGGERVFGPRDLPPDDQPPWVIEWLIEHPEWDSK
jgi:hypothetical protein